MEKYIEIEEGYPEPNKPVEAICFNGEKYEVYWSDQDPGGSWRDVETNILKMINVDKWKYL